MKKILTLMIAVLILLPVFAFDSFFRIPSVTAAVNFSSENAKLRIDSFGAYADVYHMDNHIRTGYMFSWSKDPSTTGLYIDLMPKTFNLLNKNVGLCSDFHIVDKKLKVNAGIMLDSNGLIPSIIATEIPYLPQLNLITRVRLLNKSGAAPITFGILVQ